MAEAARSRSKCLFGFFIAFGDIDVLKTFEIIVNLLVDLLLVFFIWKAAEVLQPFVEIFFWTIAAFSEYCFVNDN
jgi:hypothetical protein